MLHWSRIKPVRAITEKSSFHLIYNVVLYKLPCLAHWLNIYLHMCFFFFLWWLRWNCGETRTLRRSSCGRPFFLSSFLLWMIHRNRKICLNLPWNWQQCYNPVSVKVSVNENTRISVFARACRKSDDMACIYHCRKLSQNKLGHYFVNSSCCLFLYD